MDQWIKDRDAFLADPYPGWIDPPPALYAALCAAVGYKVVLHKCRDQAVKDHEGETGAGPTKGPHWYWEPIQCPTCSGTGTYVGLNKRIECPTCSGRKVIGGGSVHKGCSGYDGWFVHGAHPPEQDGPMVFWDEANDTLRPRR